MSENAEDKAAEAPATSQKPGGRERRDRKQVDFFRPETKQKEEFVIRPGRGIRLRDIPNVHFKIQKMKPDDEVITDLHKLLFGRPGTAHKRKKDIFEFSGFSWEGDEEKEKLKEKASKYTLAAITTMCDIFEVAKDGKKDDKIARLVDFLEDPKNLGSKDLAALDAKKKEAKKRQRERKAKDSAGKGTRGKKSKKAEEDEDEDEDDEEAADEEEEEEEEEVMVEKKPKTKRAKKAAKEEEEEEAEEPAGMDEEAADEGAEEPAEEAAEEGVEMAAEEAAAPVEQPEPAAADDSKEKKKQGKPSESPTDDELKEAVRGIVAGVDALSFSFKNLLKELTGKFPEAQFSSARKKWIKNFLVEIISPGAEPADDAMKTDTSTDATAAQPEAGATLATEAAEEKSEAAKAE